MVHLNRTSTLVYEDGIGELCKKRWGGKDRLVKIEVGLGVFWTELKDLE